jgi:hypothetical protein
VRTYCCEPRRLEVIKRAHRVNGIEFIEVLDLNTPPGAPRQRTLFVRLLLSGFVLTRDNLRIDGGDRIPSVGIDWCAAADALPAAAEAGLVDTIDDNDKAQTLVIRTDGSGDHSRYRLAIVANSGSDQPPAGYDPKLSSIEFSFKIECPSDFDCDATAACPPKLPAAPPIDYLAKDYQGFRRLMLDRLSLLVPGWSERSAADLGVTLVELLAYAADNLSYRQDAIANEAYLATARQRVSVRRHARLVDYYLHEGCNARAFVHLDVKGRGVTLPRGTQLLTRARNLGDTVVVAPGGPEYREALDQGAEVFETAHEAKLDETLGELSFHTWGDEACCLVRGETRATLRGHHRLKVGDFLIFEERVSPTTFVKEDADPARRWAVRLTEVTPSVDPSGQLFDTPAVDGPLDVTEIRWDVADALPFPLCLSAKKRPGVAISVARGNIVLVDHGLTITGEELGAVTQVTMPVARSAKNSCCGAPAAEPLPPRFRPALTRVPLTHGFELEEMLAAPIRDDSAWWPASSLLGIAPRGAMPRVLSLTGTLGVVSEEWTACCDLMDSGPAATDFIVEIEDAGRARLRFGDDANGKRPDPGTSFVARYRVGNGVAGNVGAEAIRHIVTNDESFQKVRNPMPAAGGVEPEDIEVARRDAPEAFRTQERAVTAVDYAAAAERLPEIQRAAATFRWTGSWHTVFVTADRFGGGGITGPLRARLRRHLERFRMAGYDLEVDAPRFVPLDVALHICVRPEYFASKVLKAVAEVLSSHVLPDGRLGVFHPDNFSFEQPVYLSRIVAAAQAVDGVEAIRTKVFRRLRDASPTSLDDGVIGIGRLEIAQLANDPSFPERGRLVLEVGGGK